MESVEASKRQGVGVSVSDGVTVKLLKSYTERDAPADSRQPADLLTEVLAAAMTGWQGRLRKERGTGNKE